MPVPVRVFGVDWSGARDDDAQRRRIWVAAVEHGELTDLSAGRTREETVEHLLAEASRPGPDGAPARTLVGLDFSFGFPAWFARAHGCPGGPESWDLAAELGEAWLRECPAPFFGHRGTRRPPGVELFRATERQVATSARVFPKSIFQLAGPGAVGPGSLRGMPLLTALRDRGWAVWPFDPPGERTVVELYPALAVARPARSLVTDPAGRRRFVDARAPGTARRWPPAVESRDAFDAAAAAIVLAAHHGAGSPIAAARDPDALVEGRIWAPDAAGDRVP